MSEFKAIIGELSTLFARMGIDARRNEPLAAHSSFRIGGPAALMVFPNSREQLTAVFSALRGERVRCTVIGHGSNILFDDAGYQGVIVVTTGMRQVLLDGTGLYAYCGASCAAMAQAAARGGLGGLEFAYGIPGTCGGLIFMNGGAYGSEVSELAPRVDCLDTLSGERLTLAGEALDMRYRHSVFMERPELIILGAHLDLAPADATQIRGRMEQNMAARREKQPLEYPSAGSVFKRHDGYFLGRVIEECGLKGYRIGGAQVSEKHAGFIINVGGARSADVLELISHIQNIVFDKYGFMPECEVRYIH